MVYKVIIQNGIAIKAEIWTGNYIVSTVQYYYSKPNENRIPEYALVESETEEEAIRKATELLNDRN